LQEARQGDPAQAAAEVPEEPPTVWGGGGAEGVRVACHERRLRSGTCLGTPKGSDIKARGRAAHPGSTESRVSPFSTLKGLNSFDGSTPYTPGVEALKRLYRRKDSLDTTVAESGSLSGGKGKRHGATPWRSWHPAGGRFRRSPSCGGGGRRRATAGR